MTKAFKTYLLGALVLLVGHFLPVAKMGDTSFTMMNIAAGSSYGSDTNPAVVFLVILGLGVVFALIANKIASRAGKIILYLLALLVAVLYFFILLKAQWFDSGAERAFGYWLMMLAIVVMAVGSIMGFAEKKA